MRSVDYGDADRIVTLLTPDLGKVSLLARGVRRSRKRFGGALEPYVLVRAEVGLGRGELGRLAQAQVVRPFVRILGSLPKMMLAGKGLELVRRAVPPREPDTRVFELALGWLEALEDDPPSTSDEVLLLAFQGRLLSVVGFAPELDACAGCGKRASEEQAACFDPDRGAVVCRACGGGPLRLSAGARALLRASLGRQWSAGTPWTDRQRDEARAVLEALINRHLSR